MKFSLEKFREASYLIAEVGQNHNGDLKTALEFIKVFANNGADAGKVILYNDVVLGNYTTNGLLTTSGGNGTIASPIGFGYGRITQNVAQGGGFTTITIADAKMTATNTIVVTLEPTTDNFYTVKAPVATVRSRNVGLGTFDVRVDYSLANADADLHINYWIIG